MHTHTRVCLYEFQITGKPRHRLTLLFLQVNSSVFLFFYLSKRDGLVVQGNMTSFMWTMMIMCNFLCVCVCLCVLFLLESLIIISVNLDNICTPVIHVPKCLLSTVGVIACTNL